MSLARAALVALATLAIAGTPAAAAEVAHAHYGSRIALLVAAPDGGAWVRVERGGGANAVGRASAGERFRTTAVDEALDGAAIGPDGQAWSGGLERTIFRAGNDGAVTRGATLPARGPILDNVFATAPDGRLWAASRTRLVHVAPSALDASKCDDRSPALYYRDGPQMTLERLRRGLRIAVRERARITVFAVYGNHSHSYTSDIRSARGGARRYRPLASWLRRIARELAAGRQPLLDITFIATDPDGNTTDSLPRAYRVTR